MAEYRVDELARQAGTTVRNVRAYQDRGLLAAPGRVGRVGMYSDSHLARLRIIGQLLDRGFTLGNIAELIVAWERGHQLSTVLGLEDLMAGPWSDEVPSSMTLDELAELFPGVDAGFIDEAIGLGLLVADGDGLQAPSPRLLHAGAELYAAGVPIEAVLSHARALRRDIERIAQRFLRLAAEHVLERYLDTPPEGLSDDDLNGLVDVIRRLRPLAQMAVDAELARAMEKVTLAFASEQMSHLVDLGRLTGPREFARIS